MPRSGAPARKKRAFSFLFFCRRGLGACGGFALPLFWGLAPEWGCCPGSSRLVSRNRRAGSCPGVCEEEMVV